MANHGCTALVHEQINQTHMTLQMSINMLVVNGHLVNTLALNPMRDSGMSSGPPWASKCLHPALACMYLSWLPWSP